LPDRETPAFTDHERPLAERVGDLLGRLTIEEKIGLLHQHQPPVDRLGVGPFVTGTEALHGLAWLGPATVFPQALGLASTWNPELVESVGAAVGAEVRAVHHKDPGRCGLNVWAPVVNLLRDPRWGRNEEGYAEDVLLTVTLGTAYARGLRGDDPRYLRTAPTLKHFLAYNNETRRAETSSRMPPRVLREYELPVFLAPLEAGAAVAVMASYNLVNGRPAHLSPLIGDELRRCTDDEILVVSDAFAPGNVVDIQHYHPDHVTSHAALLKAGLDSFTDNDADGGPTVRRITEALRLGLIDESDVDTAARRALTIRFRLGEFDPPAGNPYAGPAEDVVNCAAHRALAREAATQCIVLLKNSDGMLPLAAGPTRRVAVVGPLADTVHEDLYSGTLPYAVTARRGITERLGPAADVAFTEGLDRLALRLAGGGGYLTASDAPDGGYLRTATTAGTPGSQFDLIDWGHGVCALRSVANHRFITVDDTGALINSAGQPGGWVVREVFSLAESAGQTAIRHLATDTYLTVDAAGRCRTEATTAQAATRFTIERLVAGTEQAAAAARDADVAIVVLGNHPLINGRETEDRVDLSLPPAQEELLRAVHAANPRTVAVLTSSYPGARAGSRGPDGRVRAARRRPGLLGRRRGTVRRRVGPARHPARSLERRHPADREHPGRRRDPAAVDRRPPAAGGRRGCLRRRGFRRRDEGGRRRGTGHGGRCLAPVRGNVARRRHPVYGHNVHCGRRPGPGDAAGGRPAGRPGHRHAGGRLRRRPVRVDRGEYVHPARHRPRRPLRGPRRAGRLPARPHFHRGLSPGPPHRPGVLAVARQPLSRPVTSP